MSTSNAATKIIPPPQARRLRSADLSALVASDGVQLVGIDVTTPATSAKTIGVVELPAAPPDTLSFADLVAEHVVAKLHASALVSSTGVDANETPAVPPDLGSRKPLYVDLAEAAVKLGTTKEAMKKYLARHQRRDGRDTVCALGAGARAVKVRGRWRVRFDDEGRS